MNEGHGGLVAVAVIRLSFKKAMGGQLSILADQIESGILGSVAVERKLYAGYNAVTICSQGRVTK